MEVRSPRDFSCLPCKGGGDALSSGSDIKQGEKKNDGELSNVFWMGVVSTRQRPRLFKHMLAQWRPVDSLPNFSSLLFDGVSLEDPGGLARH